MDVVAHELGQATSFRIRIFERATLEGSPPMPLRAGDVMLEDEQASLEDIRHYARVVKRSLREHQGVSGRRWWHAAPQTTPAAQGAATPPSSAAATGATLRPISW